MVMEYDADQLAMRKRETVSKILEWDLKYCSIRLTFQMLE